MNASRLLTIAAFAFLLSWLLPENTSLSLWNSSSQTDTSFNYNLIDQLPEAYRLEIVFPDFVHTHTFNHGTKRIVVHVNELTSDFTLGMAARTTANYRCEFYGQDVSISGDLTITINTTYVGEIPEERRKEKNREKVIETIIDKFASL